MVDFKSMTLEEITHLVNMYPWFGAARKELACRTGQYAGAALYVLDRSILAESARSNPATEKDRDFMGLLSSNGINLIEKNVVVLGGDYFSQDAYNSVRNTDAEGYRTLRSGEQATREVQATEEDGMADDFFTETLAGIYAQQGYYEQAKDIYSKLILRYPEKSAYFATLIENMNNINNQ